MDGYALTYAACLVLTLGASFVARSPARVQATALLIAGWIGTIAVQLWTRDYASPVAFALITFVMAALFAVMGLLYNRTWAWVVSGFHVGMLFTHLAYQLTPDASVFVYLSVLSAFGYASMIAIAGQPLVRIVGGRGGRCTSYHSFMRGRSLDSSAFETKRKAQ